MGSPVTYVADNGHTYTVQVGDFVEETAGDNKFRGYITAINCSCGIWLATIRHIRELEGCEPEDGVYNLDWCKKIDQVIG